jgi:hypothetical protein
VEGVPDAVDGDQPGRALRIGLDLRAEVLHVGVDGAVADPAIRAVESVEQAGAAEDDAGMQRELLEEVELGAREVQR